MNAIPLCFTNVHLVLWPYICLAECVVMSKSLCMYLKIPTQLRLISRDDVTPLKILWDWLFWAPHDRGNRANKAICTDPCVAHRSGESESIQRHHTMTHFISPLTIWMELLKCTFLTKCAMELMHLKYYLKQVKKHWNTYPVHHQVSTISHLQVWI